MPAVNGGPKGNPTMRRKRRRRQLSKNPETRREVTKSLNPQGTSARQKLRKKKRYLSKVKGYKPTTRKTAEQLTQSLAKRKEKIGAKRASSGSTSAAPAPSGTEAQKKLKLARYASKADPKGNEKMRAAKLRRSSRNSGLKRKRVARGANAEGRRTRRQKLLLGG
tara:strand:- start:27075 stop:27569 length:495 start_codon:yes stop_codon:yes gene_type:complete